jgi:hypothetical protein
MSEFLSFVLKHAACDQAGGFSRGEEAIMDGLGDRSEQFEVFMAIEGSTGQKGVSLVWSRMSTGIMIDRVGSWGRPIAGVAWFFCIIVSFRRKDSIDRLASRCDNAR